MPSDDPICPDDVLVETSRRVRAECQRMMTRIMEESREQIDADDQAQAYEWNFAHLPPLIVNKYGTINVTEGRQVADLAKWSLTELRRLHQELVKGTIRVNPRVQQHQIPQQHRPEPSRRSRNVRIDRQHQLIDRLRGQLASKLGTPCDKFSACRIIHPMKPGTKYEENPWRWQFHPDCSLTAFPDDAPWKWNAKSCLEVLSALDADQISVTVINVAYRASAAAQLQSEGSTEIVLPESPSMLDRAQGPAHDYIDNDTNHNTINLVTQHSSPEHCSSVELEAQAGTSASVDNFSVMFAAIREESEKRCEAALAWQESLIRQTVNEKVMLDVSCLKNKILDAEPASASKSLAISTFEKKIQDAELETTRRSTVFSAVKSELACAKVEVHDLKSKLEQASKCSMTEISSLQNELVIANQTSERLRLQLTNDNAAHESTLQQAKDLAFSYSEKVSELKIQLQKAETRRDDIEISLKFANAQISTQSNDLSSLKDELEEVKTDLQKQGDISAALRKGLEAREKDFEGLQLSHNDLQKQLEKRKEDFQDLQRMNHDTKIQLENCEKEKENVQQEMSQRVEDAKAHGISAGRESAIKDMAEERTAVWRSHLKQIEQVRQEAIGIGKASALEGRAVGSEGPKGLDRERIEALLSLHKSWSGVPPDLLPEPGVLSTQAIVLLEILSTKMDSLEAYKLLKEAVHERGRGMRGANSDATPAVTIEDVQQVLDQSAPESEVGNNSPAIHSPPPSEDELADSSNSATAKPREPEWGSRSSSEERHNSQYVTRRLGWASVEESRQPETPTPQKRPITNSDSTARKTKRPKSISSDHESLTIIVDASHCGKSKKIKSASTPLGVARCRGRPKKIKPCANFPNLSSP